MRKASVKRTTKETDVAVAVDLDGTGASSIATGIGFLDHMLDLLARHSRIDITVKAKGDLHIDHHHTTEDVGIALGQAIKQALGDMKGITRYADVHVPMDEALTRVAIDISGRPFLVFQVEFVRAKIGAFDTALVRVSPQTYDEVISTYKTPIVGLMELGLVAAVLYHALNGIRVILIDFWAQGTRYQRLMLWAIAVIWLLVMVPATVVVGIHMMGRFG